MFETQSSQLLLCFSVTPACIIVTSIKPESWSFYIKSFSKLFDLNRRKSSEPVGVSKHEEGVILLPGEDSRLTATLTWRTSVVLSLQHNSSRNLQHVGAAAVASERLKLWTEIMQRLKKTESSEQKGTKASTPPAAGNTARKNKHMEKWNDERLEDDPSTRQATAGEQNKLQLVWDNQLMIHYFNNSLTSLSLICRFLCWHQCNMNVRCRCTQPQNDDDDNEVFRIIKCGPPAP